MSNQHEVTETPKGFCVVEFADEGVSSEPCHGCGGPIWVKPDGNWNNIVNRRYCSTRCKSRDNQRKRAVLVQLGRAAQRVSN